MTVFISRLLNEPMVNLSAFQGKEIPKYCANKSQLVSKKLKLNYIFRKSARAVFCRPSCDKRQTVVEMGKVKLKSCKSERIVPIWGVVRKSKCQLREEIRSEWAKKSIFRIFSKCGADSKYKGGGGWNCGEGWERGLLCFVQSSVLQVSSPTISASLFLLGLKLWRSPSSHWREAVIWGFVQLEQSIGCVQI